MKVIIEHPDRKVVRVGTVVASEQTQDIQDALNGATTPSASNVFQTYDDFGQTLKPTDSPTFVELNVDGLVLDVDNEPDTKNPGTIYWDGSDKTASLVVLGGSEVQLGQELHVYARNATGTTISNGTVVYVNGASGGRPTITKAIASDSTAHKIIGVTTQDISNNSNGYVTISGVVRDVDLTGFAEGTELYLSADTAGTLTSTSPTGDNYIVQVGTVLGKTGNSGNLLVAIKCLGRYEVLYNSTYWEDFRTSAVAINPPGAVSDPDRDPTDGLLRFDPSSTELVYIYDQMPHRWKEGTAVIPHVHWKKTTAAAGNVAWRLEYDIANIGGDFNDSWTTLATISTPIAATTDNNTVTRHLITSFGTLDMTGITMSAMFKFRLSRIGGDASDTYAGDAKLLSFDFHYQFDRPGSRDEYIK